MFCLEIYRIFKGKMTHFLEKGRTSPLPQMLVITYFKLNTPLSYLLYR